MVWMGRGPKDDSPASLTVQNADHPDALTTHLFCNIQRDVQILSMGCKISSHRVGKASSAQNKRWNWPTGFTALSLGCRHDQGSRLECPCPVQKLGEPGEINGRHRTGLDTLGF